MTSRGEHFAFALLLCLFVGIQDGACLCSNVSELSSQLDALLSEYDREQPPPSSPAARVMVLLTLDVRHASVLEYASSMRILADLHMSWQDSRITWNATEWGCDWALASGERVWAPDISLVNAAATTTGDQPLSARITSTGQVSWNKRLDVSIPIEIELENWPNDVQLGDFKFASRAHDIEEIDFIIKEEAIVYESSAWEIVSVSGETSLLGSVRQVAEDGVRRLAAWRVELRRRAPGQALAARVALTAALMLLAAAVLLPPTTRTPLAATAALVLALWLCCVVWRLPEGRDAPRAVRLAGAVCAAAGAAAVGAALVLRVARFSLPPPGFVKSVVYTTTRVFTLSPVNEGAGGENGTWVAAARVLDTMLVTTLLLIIFVLLCVYL